jgi:flagellar export protein FliJ
VKKFHFPLERVREWRETQARLEEAKLEKLNEERRAVEERMIELEREKSENETAVLGGESTDALALRALDEYRRFAKFRRSTLAREREDADAKAAAQRSRIIEAQRRVRLLEKLKARKAKLWHVSLDKEIEEQAAEAFLAKWNHGSDL